MKLSKKILTLLIIVSIFLCATPQKANAQYIDVMNLAKEFPLDTIATVIGKMMLKKITAQTVNWINSGFEGRPAFVTDPNQFFLDVADNTASSYLSEGRLNQLCTPFKAQVRLALVQNYLQEDDNFSCTLDTLKNNYEAFTQDFTQGGWDGWFEMTQTSGGNPYSAYFAAQSGLLKNLSNKKETQEKEISTSGGLLDFKACKEGTKTTEADYDAMERMLEEDGWTPDQIGEYLAYEMPKIGECKDKDKETVTPGTAINKMLGDTLGSGWKQLQAADEINEIVTALVSQILNQAFGKASGLLGASKPSNNEPSYTQQLMTEQEPPAIDPGQLEMTQGTSVCRTDEETGEEVCKYTPGTIKGPEWLTPIENLDTPFPSPAQCLQQDGNYAGALRGAMDAVLSANPDVANSMNTTANSYAFLALVAKNAPSGYQISDQVLNGHDNPNRGDLLAIWRNSDSKMERYDVISDAGSGNKKISASVYTGFTGSISLNCTSSGGGKGCHCEIDPSTGSNPGVPNPTVLTPEITTISPTTIMAGGVLTITGKNLVSTVQFFDVEGTRTTEVGQGSGDGNKITVKVPSNIKTGNYTVKIRKDENTSSNGKSLVIKGKTEPTIPTVAVTSKWTPPQTNNGWWAQVSPDGKYVAYGNWGESWVTSLESTSNPKQTWDFSKPSGLPTGARCKGGQWIATTTLSFVCELADKGVGGFYRYEVKVGEWTAKKTSDDPNLVNGNWGDTRDGHWTSYLASRIAIDNKTLPATTGIGARDPAVISNNQLVFGCDVTRNPDGLQSICQTDFEGTLIKKYPIKIPNFGMAFNNSYIAYGGFGPIHGINPSGTDIDLTVAPWRYEGVSSGGLFYVGKTLWVATISWDENTGNGFTLLRPWGETRVIAIVGDAIGASVAVRDGNFVIAYFDAVGKMYVVTVPINSQRSVLN